MVVDGERQQCEVTKPDGTRCRARVLPGDTRCFAHSERTRQQREAGRRAGGRERSRRLTVLPADTPDLELRTVGDVTLALAATINQVRKGAIDAKVANAVGYLTSVLLRALEGDDLARQLAELRAELEQMKGGSHGGDSGDTGTGGGAVAGGDRPPQGEGAAGDGPPAR
jgi:hypothetical protein